MAATRARAGDTAAKTAEKLAKEKEADLLARRDELTTIAAQEEEARLNEVVDMTNPSQPVVEEVDEVVELGITDPVAATVVMRVNEKLEQVTIGVGNHYDFEVGRQYKVTKQVYDHLDELGYVWH